MNILVLNGSPRPAGNTASLIKAFADGAEYSGNVVSIVNVCKLKISGCIACEYCHTEGNGRCVINDDMAGIYPLLDEAEMIVLASPIYYHSLSGQLQCTLNRIYALDRPKKLKKAALLLSSESEDVYDGAVYEFKKSFIEYLGLENMGIFSCSYKDNAEHVKGKINNMAKRLV